MKIGFQTIFQLQINLLQNTAVSTLREQPVMSRNQNQSMSTAPQDLVESFQCGLGLVEMLEHIYAQHRIELSDGVIEAGLLKVALCDRYVLEMTETPIDGSEVSGLDIEDAQMTSVEQMLGEVAPSAPGLQDIVAKVGVEIGEHPLGD